MIQVTVVKETPIVEPTEFMVIKIPKSQWDIFDHLLVCWNSNEDEVCAECEAVKKLAADIHAATNKAYYTRSR